MAVFCLLKLKEKLLASRLAGLDLGGAKVKTAHDTK